MVGIISRDIAEVVNSIMKEKEMVAMIIATREEKLLVCLGLTLSNQDVNALMASSD